jgi:peroxiredoxin
MPVAKGQHAPDFTLLDADRKPRKLSEFRGKTVILAFFPGAFTGVCSKEACTLRDSAAQFNSANAQVVGVAVDSSFALKGWSDVNKLTFPVLSDFDRKVVNEYGVTWKGLGGMEGYISANRAVFVVDKNGVVQYTWVAPQPGVEPPYEEVTKAAAALK